MENDYDLHKASGFEKLKFNDYEGAIKDFSLAIDTDPFNNADTVVPFCLRSIKQKLDNSEVIESSFIEDVLRSSNYNNSARINLRLKEFKNAIENYSSIIKLLPDEYVTYQKRAAAKIKIKDFDGALDDFTNALIIHQNNSGSEKRKLEFMLTDYDGNVDFIKHCANLAQDNSHSKSLKNSKAVNFLQKLKYLDIQNNAITDISPLQSLPKLEYINLKKNNIHSIEPISHFTNLEEVHLGEILDEGSVFELFKNSEVCTISYSLKNATSNSNHWIQSWNIHLRKNKNKEIKVYLEGFVLDKFGRKFSNDEVSEFKDLMFINFQQKIFSLLHRGEEIVSKQEFITDDLYMEGVYRYI